MCTFNDCDQGSVEYTTREAWRNHEFSEHIDRRECTSQSTSSDERKTPLPLRTFRCNICLDDMLNDETIYTHHVLRHLENIALMACPCDEEEDSEPDILVPARDQNASTYGTNASSHDPFPSAYLPTPSSDTISSLNQSADSLSHIQYESAHSTIDSSDNATAGSGSANVFAQDKNGSSSPSLYHCLIDGCSYSSTRAYDVKRHTTMHYPSRIFPCEYS